VAPKREALIAAGTVALTSLAGVLLRDHIAATNLAMLFLLGVVAVASTCGRRVSVWTAFASVAAFDFFCVPPYQTFAVHDYEYLLMFAGMLAVALVIGTQTGKLREFARQATDREARTEALYRLSRSLAQETRVFEAARSGAEMAGEILHTPVVIFLTQDGRISFERRTSDHLPVPSSDIERAQQVFESGHRSPTAGKTAGVHYLPMRGTRQTLGVMAVLADSQGRGPSKDMLQVADLIATQIALALERILSQGAAEESRFKVRTEQMRSSLLSAVSHDLRTPLAAITGSASTLRTQDSRLDPQTRAELIENISEEAERLERLVSNLLDMTRLESGGVTLQRESFPLEEIVGTALQRLDRQLAKREVTVDLAEDLPMVQGDEVLLGQLLWNLLENAIKYTPADSPIEIAARRQENSLVLEVRDRGPGITAGEEERIFEKFFRGERILHGNSWNSRGAGLGLPICRAIAEAHGGSIQALPREGGGVVFRIRLPLEVAP